MNYRNHKSLVESLEGRTLFAAVPTAAVLDGVLEVTGTRRAETIEVSVDVVDSTKVNVAITGAETQQFNLADFALVRVNGGNGADVISVLGLRCELFGGNGRDTLMADTGDNHLDGGNGRDTLTAGAGIDMLIGGNGKDTLLSGAGADTLSGGNGKDTLDAGDGDDTLDGGKGRDLLTGGLGADHFLGRDKVAEILDMSLDDTHTDLSLVNGLIDGFVDLFEDLFTL